MDKEVNLKALRDDIVDYTGRPFVLRLEQAARGFCEANPEAVIDDSNFDMIVQTCLAHALPSGSELLYYVSCYLVKHGASFSISEEFLTSRMDADVSKKKRTKRN